MGQNLRRYLLGNNVKLIAREGLQYLAGPVKTNARAKTASKYIVRVGLIGELVAKRDK
jgi:hypothetical protein